LPICKQFQADTDYGTSGVIGLDTQDRDLMVICARSVILRQAGSGNCARRPAIPTMPRAMGYRAGTILSDLEFIQFYPGG